MKYLFIHGGPGLNSEPERKALGPIAEARGIPIDFWNEPSNQFPNGYPFSENNAYANSVASAETMVRQILAQEPQVHLIAHSFGANIAADLAQKFPNEIAGITFVAPALDMDSAFKNLMRLALFDAKERSDEAAVKTLQKSLAETKTFYDLPMQVGMSVFAQSPKLISYYWTETPGLHQWLAIIQTPEFAPNPQTQAAVLRSFSPGWRAFSAFQLKTPVQVLFGEQDHFITPQIELRLLHSLFDRVEVISLRDNGHFLHLEDPLRFLQILQGFDRKEFNQAAFETFADNASVRALISKRLSQTDL